MTAPADTSVLDVVPSYLTYRGGEDLSSGLAEGRGTQEWATGAGVCRFEGRFRRGKRHGLGRLHLPTGTTVAARWVDGRAQGRARLVDADGDVVSGILSMTGEIEGADAREEYADGSLRYTGGYADSERNGPGIAWLPDGATMDGFWRGDEFHSPGESSGTTTCTCTYTYPDQETHLTGVWQDGVMVEATLAGGGPLVYQYDPPSCSSPGAQPLLADPYEAKNVVVGPSNIAGAGEGLFAKRALPGSTVVVYYSGLRLPRNAVDERTWEENANCIALNPRTGNMARHCDGGSETDGGEDEDEEGEEIIIDVPPELSRTDQYCATLGHKVNHARPPHANTEYDFCTHPRFGDIRCVRTLRPIASGEELLCDYGYGRGSRKGPDWFVQSCKASQAT